MIRFLAANETMQWIVYAVGALTILFVVLRPSLRKKDPLAQSGPKMSMAQQRSVVDPRSGRRVSARSTSCRIACGA